MSDMEELTSTSTSHKQCRLLLIPQELRDRIYRYALVTDRAIVWPSAGSSNELSPCLLATCKQIHQEAAPILYKYNRFTFCHPSDCNIFRHIMDSRHVVSISRVAFKIRESDLHLWTSYITAATNRDRSLVFDLPNLQSLVIFFRQNGRAHDIDEENMFSEWHQNRHLQHLCMSLEHRTRADLTVLFSARMRNDERLETIRSLRPDMFITQPGEVGYLRTRPIELRSGVHVELELVSAERQYATPVT